MGDHANAAVTAASKYYTDLRRQIISEAKEEIEAKKAEAKKPRRTKVVVIDDFKSGISPRPVDQILLLSPEHARS